MERFSRGGAKSDGLVSLKEKAEGENKDKNRFLGRFTYEE